MLRRGLFALGVFAAACGHALPATAPVHGNLVAHAAGDERGSRREGAAALVVLVEDARVRAIDADTAESVWVLPLAVTGHPVANATTIYLPVQGHRLVAVDRARGTVRFSIDLPGEALTGLDVSSQWLVATVVGGGRRGGEQARAELVVMASHDGHVRWRHRADRVLGIPAVHGGVAVVPVPASAQRRDEGFGGRRSGVERSGGHESGAHESGGHESGGHESGGHESGGQRSGGQIVAFRVATGREVARQDVPAGAPLERIVHHGDAWLVGGGDTWFELGQGGKLHALDGAHAPVFPEVNGIDPGHDEGERLRMWLGLADHAIARDALLLSRRAVVSLRIDGEGRASRARWVHLEERGEFVAMEVVGDRVVLVREDGAIVLLSAATGQPLDRIAGGDPVRGALVLGAGPGRAPMRRDGEDPIEGLHRLLLDPDPRLLPAQQLAAELLWRDDNADVRAAVVALSAGAVRTEQTDAAEALRDHAATLTAGRWGQGDGGEVEAVLVALRQRPRVGVPEDAIAPAIREAARRGSPEVVAELGALLLHPGTRPVDLVEIVKTLARLRDPAAVDALATFLRRYHADQGVAYESTALRATAALLLDHAADTATTDDDAGERARIALRAVVADPLCEPALRAFIAQGLRQLAAETPDERTPLLSSRL